QAEYDEARWTISTFLEANKKRSTARREKIKHLVRGTLEQVRTVGEDARRLVAGWGQLADVLDEPFTPQLPPPVKDPLRKMQRALAAADELARRGDAQSRKRCKHQLAASTRRCQDNLRKADDRYLPLVASVEKRHNEDIRQADAKYKPLLVSLREHREEEERHAE